MADEYVDTLNPILPTHMHVDPGYMNNMSVISANTETVEQAVKEEQ